MSKERLEEITQMVNSFDDSSFFATLYGYEMDSKALISDFVFLINHIKNQQAEIDTLSMAHDEMHRLLPKDKHTLIKTIHSINERVRDLELASDLHVDEVTQLDELVDELKHENKRYRETLGKIADKREVDFGNSYTNRVYNHSRKLARQALEGEE